MRYPKEEEGFVPYSRNAVLDHQAHVRAQEIAARTADQQTDRQACPFAEDDHIEHSGIVRKRRMNTQYSNDEDNYLTSCRACFCNAWSERQGDWESYQEHSPYSDEPPSEEMYLADTIESLERENTALRDALAVKEAALEAVRQDAGRWKYQRDKGARVIECHAERIGYRSTTADAPREKWGEFTGWTVSTLPVGVEFPTMDEAMDAAIAQEMPT